MIVEKSGGGGGRGWGAAAVAFPLSTPLEVHGVSARGEAWSSHSTGYSWAKKN